jgi:hypothetical protein
MGCRGSQVRLGSNRIGDSPLHCTCIRAPKAWCDRRVPESNSTVRADSGTRCSRPALIRSPGMGPRLRDEIDFVPPVPAGCHAWPRWIDASASPSFLGRSSRPFRKRVGRRQVKRVTGLERLPVRLGGAAGTCSRSCRCTAPLVQPHRGSAATAGRARVQPHCRERWPR